MWLSAGLRKRHCILSKTLKTNKANRSSVLFNLENLSPFEFRTHWLELPLSLHLVPPIHDTKPSVFTVLYLRGRSTFKNLNPEALVFIELPE